MTFEERIKRDITWRLRAALAVPKDTPMPAVQEIAAGAYPPADARSWCIPVPRRDTVLSYPKQDDESAAAAAKIDSLWVDRERWIGRGLSFWVWKGYHAETNTIYYAVRLAPTVTVDWKEATTASAPTRAP